MDQGASGSFDVMAATSAPPGSIVPSFPPGTTRLPHSEDLVQKLQDIISQELGMDMRSATSCCVFCNRAFADSRMTQAGKCEIKVLRCLHSSCGGCLEQKIREGREVKCPICDVRSAEDTYHKYLCNHAAHQGIDFHAFKQKKDVPACDECIEASPGEMYCRTCVKTLCHECINHHRRSRVTCMHQLVDLKEQQEDEVIHRAAFCPNHLDQLLEFFCETCNIMCCRECILRDHESHSYKLPAGGLVTKEKKMMKDQIHELRTLAQRLHERHQVLADSIKDLDVEIENADSNLDHLEKQVTSALSERKKAALQDVETRTTNHRHFIEKTRDSLTTTMVSMWKGIDFVEKVLARGTNIEVLFLKSYLSSQFPYDDERFGSGNMETDGGFGVSWAGDAAQVAATLRGMAEVQLGASPPVTLPEAPRKRYLARASDQAMADFEPAKVPLPAHKLWRDFLDKGLHSKDDDQIRVDGIGSRTALIGTEGAVRGLFRSPCGVGVDRTTVYVGDTLNHRIQAFDRETHAWIGFLELNSTEAEELQDPSGLCCLDDGHLLVVEYGRDRVLEVLTQATCESLKTIRAKQFTNRLCGLYGPFGIACNKDHVVVADSCNHRCVVFDVAGQQLLEFGSRGTGPGQFEYPQCICVQIDGTFLVSDKANNRIQVFDASGNFCHFIPNFWTEMMRSNQHATDLHEGKPSCSRQVPQGRLLGPTGMCCDSKGRVYVCDCGGNRIQIFTRHGHWLWSSDVVRPSSLQYDFKSPTGVAIDEAGHLYVVSDHCLQIF